jgi:membrane-bound serine protease (ClpP class)
MDPLLLWGLGLIGAAILLVILEVFVPSAGILTVTAVVVAIAGVVCLFLYETAWGVAGMLTVIVLGPLVGFGAVQLWRHTPLGRKMIGVPSEDEIERRREAEQRERESRMALLGAEGVAITDLRPVGIIRIGDQRMDALAQTFMIPAGSRVKVVQVEGNQIKVRAI